MPRWAWGRDQTELRERVELGGERCAVGRRQAGDTHRARERARLSGDDEAHDVGVALGARRIGRYATRHRDVIERGVDRSTAQVDELEARLLCDAHAARDERREREE